MNLGDIKCSVPYSCSISCLSRLYCGGGSNLYKGGVRVWRCGCIRCRYVFLLLYLTVAIVLLTKALG